ncbi:exodeoxyribonuclease VII small subunit [Verrucomicrobiaceae bacterium N1E253]|uniref:Exodeoxyribonuclease 7 small subunit n=1 Tax=Oceaniferula marina TaxID=2748318 RepID=A0A851GMC7_9BACT|nr:exodeoxyribonuclease VII small subunit [Oceaniferula marina]NWK56991.1 exodeoxyribonuclease VII small subunit [Oceaniferula marina]
MPPSKKKKDPSFEQALDELETMVETMESGQLPLEQLISHYERGATLITHCEKVLDDARKRLELLTLKPSSDNDPAEETNPKATPAESFNDDDEIRLF